MKPRIAAIVPMRHQSERVPGKNYRTFAGRPLYHRVIESLLNCPLVNEVVIDTDSEFITRDVVEYFPAVRVIERPEHLRGGDIPMNEVLRHSVRLVDADFYLQTHSTNPLLTPETVTRAIQAYIKAYPAHDSLFSVRRLQVRLWDAAGRPINHDPAVLLRTQDLPPVFEENSCLYIFTRKNLEARRNRIGERPLMFEMDNLESLDIDNETDFRIAELLYLERQRKTAGKET